MMKNKILYIGIGVVVIAIAGGLFFAKNKMNINSVLAPITGQKATAEWTKKIPHFSVLKTKMPKPYTALATTKMISATKGGEVSVYDSPHGVLIKLSIPAGGLSKDTNITVTPLLEVPIENYTSKLGNGVLVEPEGLKFLKNATLTFDFKPSNEDILIASGVSDQNGSVMSAQEPGVPNTLPKGSGVVHVDSIKDLVSRAHAVRTQYGSKLMASISSLSSFVPDDLSGANGKAVSESELPSAAEDGVCSPQFLNAAANIIGEAQLAGDDETANGVTSVLEDCGKKAVDDLEAKCKENPMQVGRRMIMNVMQFVQLVGPAEEAPRVEKIMTDCKREYTMKGSETVNVQGGNSLYAINAKLCGFLDEQWEGKETIDFTMLGAHQYYHGNVKFFLPEGGGEFYMPTAGTGGAESPFTQLITLSYSGPGLKAFFDDTGKTVFINYKGYGSFLVEAPITVKKTDCVSTNQQLNELTGW